MTDKARDEYLLVQNKMSYPYPVTIYKNKEPVYKAVFDTQSDSRYEISDIETGRSLAYGTVQIDSIFSYFYSVSLPDNPVSATMAVGGFGFNCDVVINNSAFVINSRLTSQQLEASTITIKREKKLLWPGCFVSGSPEDFKKVDVLLLLGIVYPAYVTYQS